MVKEPKSKIDIGKLIEIANKPETFFSLLPTIDFKKVGGSFKSKQHSFLSIYRDPSGIWIFKNHNSTKYDLPDGDIWTFTKRLHKLDVSREDGLLKCCKIIADASGQYIDDLHEIGTPAPKRITPIQKPSIKKYTPNDAYPLRKTSKPVYDDLFLKPVCDYFSKYGITPETLKKYDIRPLKQVVYESGYTINFCCNDFAFAYLPDGEQKTIKYKRPNAPKDKKERFIQSSGNYVFGLKQLPKDCSAFDLIICAGEKDTICINHHFNAYGIYAICFGSETTTLNTEYVKHLKSKFNSVFCLFDNDDTGAKMMRKNAIDYGIPFIDIASHVNDQEKYPSHKFENGINQTLNDVADILEHVSFDELRTIICIEKATKVCIQRIESDPFSIGVADALKLDIKQYISEDDITIDLLSYYILTNKKLMLAANTGAGKTFAIIALAMLRDFYEKNGIKKIIFCVPVTLSADQLQKDFKDRGIDAPVIKEGFSDFESIEIENNKVIICTYDSLKKVNYYLDESLLIVDEHHLLRDDYDYRDKAVSSVFESIEIAKKTVVISATPLLELTTEIAECFHFRLCLVNAEIQQEKTIQPILYRDGSERDVNNHWLNNREDNNGVHILKKNDVAMLEAFAQVSGSDQSTIISSKQPKYKEQNPNYQSIVENGTIENGIKNLYVTSLMDTAISLKFQVDSVALINPKCINATIQSIARPRMKDNVNEHIKVYTYHSTSENEAQRILDRFKQSNSPVNENAHTGTEHTIQHLKSMIDFAQKNADNANAHQTEMTETKFKYYDTLNDIYYSELHGQWRIKIGYILFKENQRKKALSDVYDFYQRINTLYPTIRINTPIVIDLATDAETKAILSDKTAVTKEQKTKAFDIFKIDTRNSMRVQYTLTASTKQRKQIKSELTNVSKELTGSPAQLYDDNSDVFDTGAMHTPISRYFKLKSLDAIKPDKLPAIVKNVQQERDFKEFYNTIVAQIELQNLRAAPDDLSGKAIIRAQESDKLIQAIRKLKDNARKSKTSKYDKGKLILPKSKLIQLYKDATGKVDKLQAITMRITELYEFEEIKPRKKTMLFSIGKRKVLSKIIKKANHKNNGK